MVSKFLRAFAATIALASFTSASPVSLFRRTLVVDSVEPPQQEIILSQQPTGAFVTYTVVGENFVVTYGDVLGQTYQEVHLYIGTIPPPTNAPGQFPYTSNNGYCSISGDKQTATCTIPLSLIGTDLCAQPPTTYYIASHAAHTSESDPTSTGGQTSWGDGPTCISINEKTGKCAPWAIYSTFTFKCKEPEVPPNPTKKECERGTGFGYPTQGVSASDIGLLNTIGNSNRWGWYFGVPTTYLNSGGVVSGDIHVGAGQNDLSKGFVAGTFEIKLSGGNVLVTYNLVGNYDLMETHVYASCSKPTATNPGGFGHTNTQSAIDPADQLFTVTIPASELPCLATGGTVYFILHAKVGEIVDEGAECKENFGD